MAENSDGPRDVLRTGGMRARSGLEDKLGDLSSAIMIKAVLVAILGLCLLVWPVTSLRFLMLAIAALLIFDGVAGMVSALRAGEHGGYLGQSILSLIIGGILLLWPDVTMGLLFRLAGIWAVLTGAALFWSLRQIPSDDSFRSTQLTVAVVLALVGVALLFWPNAGAVTLSWVIGVAALIIAAALFWLARRMKKLGRRVASPVA
jgi:uncharacterized membrane protein HdeD (DUF308 family)